jgi:ferredoxin
MEGNGPMNGTPRKMNLLIFSADPVALDATVCRIIGIDPKYSLTVAIGEESGLGVYAEKEIELLGDPLESFVDKGFDVDRDQIIGHKSGRGVTKFVINMVVPRPYILPDKCIKCGVCIKACPVDPKALSWRDENKTNPPVYQYRRCIRCYCCQELCPEGAVQIKKPLLKRLFGKKITT